MRKLSHAFDAQTRSECTTFCYCWMLRRKDDVVLGFTNHDRDLELDGLIYQAASGFSPSDFDSRLGFALDNSAVSGVLASDAITDEDVRSGKYDGAALTVWQVNWQDTSVRHKIWSGYIGEISLKNGAFEAELVGHAIKLERTIGRVFSRVCDASFGDERCGLNINDFPPGTECARTLTACRDQFSNTENFRGFPYLIGDDAVYATPQDGEIMDGGSRYKP